MTRYLTAICFYLISCAQPPTDEPVKNYTDKHNEAFAFCNSNAYSKDFYFLIDLSVHSGKNRFFVYDFKQKKVVHQNLVTHGSCDVFKENDNRHKVAKYDNRDNSHCSSLGKYKIGKRDYSSWGINVKYWLDGLEETNDNARKRVVVLHSWEAVADKEIYPAHSPLSWGCPAVSDDFMRILDKKLQSASKPVLLWVIN